MSHSPVQTGYATFFVSCAFPLTSCSDDDDKTTPCATPTWYASPTSGTSWTVSLMKCA